MCDAAERVVRASEQLAVAAAALGDAAAAFLADFEAAAAVLVAAMQATRMTLADEDYERALLPAAVDRWGVRVVHAKSGTLLTSVLVPWPFYAGAALDVIAERMEGARPFTFEATSCSSGAVTCH